VVTGSFLVLVILIVAANARLWCRILLGRTTPAPREEPFFFVMDFESPNKPAKNH